MIRFPCICEYCKYSKIDYDFDVHSYRLFCDNVNCPVSFAHKVEPDDGCVLFEDKYDYIRLNRCASE